MLEQDAHDCLAQTAAPSVQACVSPRSGGMSPPTLAAACSPAPTVLKSLSPDLHSPAAFASPPASPVLKDTADVATTALGTLPCASPVTPMAAARQPLASPSAQTPFSPVVVRPAVLQMLAAPSPVGEFLYHVLCVTCCDCFLIDESVNMNALQSIIGRVCRRQPA